VQQGADRTTEFTPQDPHHQGLTQQTHDGDGGLASPSRLCPTLQ
jgi:hypothetical protein